MSYTLYGRAGWGSAIVEAQLVWYRLPLQAGAGGRPAARACLARRAGARQSAGAGADADDARRQRDERECGDHVAAGRHHRQRCPGAGTEGRRTRPVPALAGIHRRQHLPDLHLCRRSGALRLGQHGARSLPRRHRCLRPAPVAPDRERGQEPVVPGQPLLGTRHLSRHHDALAATPRLVRERGAAPVRDRAAHRYGTRARTPCGRATTRPP